jgi:hypothetical protein
MPEMGGVEVCKAIRGSSNVAIISQDRAVGRLPFRYNAGVRRQVQEQTASLRRSADNSTAFPNPTCRHRAPSRGGHADSTSTAP